MDLSWNILFKPQPIVEEKKPKKKKKIDFIDPFEIEENKFHSALEIIIDFIKSSHFI